MRVSKGALSSPKQRQHSWVFLTCAFQGNSCKPMAGQALSARNRHAHNYRPINNLLQRPTANARQAEEVALRQRSEVFGSSGPACQGTMKGRPCAEAQFRHWYVLLCIHLASPENLASLSRECELFPFAGKLQPALSIDLVEAASGLSAAIRRLSIKLPSG